MTWESTTSGNSHCSGTRTLLTGSVNAIIGFTFADYREVTDSNVVESGTASLEFIEGTEENPPTLGTVEDSENVLVVPVTVPDEGQGYSLWAIKFYATLTDGQVIVGAGELRIKEGCIDDGEDENDGCEC